MKRSKRLAVLMEILKDGTVHRAEDLAVKTKVSVRTIYRDMETMIASGVPIEGERGLGYMAKAVITLPPLNLTHEELEALHLGLVAISTSMDAELGAAATSLSAKLEDALPETSDGPSESFGFAVYPFEDGAIGLAHLNTLRAAVRARQRLRISLSDQAAQDLRPLKIDYWGRMWTLIAYSETQNRFAAIRVDLIADISVLPGLFVDEPGMRLADYMALKSATKTL